MDTTIRDLINFCSDKLLRDKEILEIFYKKETTCIYCDETKCLCEKE